ncbi:MAG: ArgE/DapE family deacylase [Solirubrobacterales bacterium]|nr:ArgE/DapE family deacylase [Solirubrobacterales bacterium]
MLELLERLVRAPTVLGHEEDGQAIFEQAMTGSGLGVREVRMDPEAIRTDPHGAPFGWEVGGKRNLIGTWPGAGDGEAVQAARSLILGGHIDVVPPAADDLWTTGPFEPRTEGDWLYGRGAGDMKAGLVAILGAVRALRELGAEPLAPVHLVSVVEEECTGNGALACVLDGLEADGCVLTEPHYDHITTAQVGVLWFDVEVAGRAAHAGHAELGANAIDGLSTVIASLRELEQEMNQSPPPPYDGFEHPIHLNVGMVEGGDWPSTVAARAHARCRIGLYPGQQPDQIRRRVEQAVVRAGRRDPFLAENPATVSYEGFACEGFALPDDEPIAVAMAEAAEVTLGFRPPLVPTTATTDARHLVRTGTPAVCFGPQAEFVHGIDERVSISSIEGSARALAELIGRWTGLRFGTSGPGYDHAEVTHSATDRGMEH